jgi:hypothetical protein
LGQRAPTYLKNKTKKNKTVAAYQENPEVGFVVQFV